MVAVVCHAQVAVEMVALATVVANVMEPAVAHVVTAVLAAVLEEVHSLSTDERK